MTDLPDWVALPDDVASPALKAYFDVVKPGITAKVRYYVMPYTSSSLISSLLFYYTYPELNVPYSIKPHHTSRLHALTHPNTWPAILPSAGKSGAREESFHHLWP